MSSKGWTVHVHQLFAYSSTVLFKLLTALLRHNFSHSCINWSPYNQLPLQRTPWDLELV